MDFNQEFDQHGAWRRQFALRLKLLSEWLVENDLMEAGVRERLDQLHAQVRNDKIMVAFVAEFSRGKSELINAMFFAGYGRRIMPASAGRTTMCPTELGFDPEIPPCLRLLPIETRLQPQSLLDWRNAPDKWERVDLDVNFDTGSWQLTPDQVDRLSVIADGINRAIERNPREVERTVAISPHEVDDWEKYIEAGADHLIVMLGHPYDLSSAERLLGLVGA